MYVNNICKKAHTHRNKTNSYNLEKKALCVYLVLTVLVTVSGTVRGC